MSKVFSGSFPSSRMRRLRRAPWIRDMVAEHQLCASDLIWPVFVCEDDEKERDIATMPGVKRLTIDELVDAAKKAQLLGMPAIALFPVTPADVKTHDGREATNPNNLVCRAIKAIKKSAPDVGIICDVALDPYTTHGHDGIVYSGDVDNDATVEVLCEQALVQAKAGCDIIAPSDMMDGRVGKIREVLDENKLINISILSYGVKFSSSFYGPFRHAVGSAKSLGKADKKTYQMDYRNADEALREVSLDISEGADMVMVKPGMPYLDIIRQIASRFAVPVFAYQVSGEYAMLKAAADAGAIDYHDSMIESLVAFKRAGASGILTYAAIDIAQQLK